MTARAKGLASKSIAHSLDSAPARTAFRKSLLRWFNANARDLPWRRTSDPYAIWLSEIMLQQTQVATVVAYYERFLKRFPTISHLAQAHEQDVLKLWEGLGYYRRARQLHAASRVVASQHAGEFPCDFEQIRALPGIGRYTAGAIASFAYNDRQPIVEANTIRLYCRLLGIEEDPRSKAVQQKLWQFAEEILPARNPGQINQALIELGSQVCKPRQPLCDACPVARHCLAKQINRVDLIPKAAKKTNYEDALEAAVVVRDQKGRILLRQRTNAERWAGMWDFPRGNLAIGSAALEPASLDLVRVSELVTNQTGAKINLIGERFRIRHGVTRFRIELVCFDADLLAPLKPREDLRWVSAAQLTEIPLSVSARKLAKNLATNS